jgi:hypothetical protein
MSFDIFYQPCRFGAERVAQKSCRPSTWHHDEPISEIEVSGPPFWALVQSREFPNAGVHVYGKRQHLWCSHDRGDCDHE